MDAVALVVISLFLKFHIALILTNSSTIENLDKKRSNTKSLTANVIFFFLMYSMIWDIIIIGFKFLERRLFFGPSLYIWNPENLLEMVLFTHKNTMSIYFL